MPILILATASFASWFVSMLVGGGSPFILIPLISLLLGSQAVAPVITVGLLLGNTQRSLFFWREINWRITSWYLPGALGGAILGAIALVHMHAEWLQSVLAIGLIFIGLNQWLSHRAMTFQVQAWYFLPVSMLNAVGSGLIGSTGPVMNPLYLNYGLNKEAMVATKAFNKAWLHLIKLIAYAILGQLSLRYLGYGVVIGLAAMPANWLGKLALAQLTQQQFHQLVMAFVLFSGLVMFWQQRSLLPL